MTIFRFRSPVLAFALVSVFATEADSHQIGRLQDCEAVMENTGQYEADGCYERNLAIKEEEMLAAYQAALRFLRASDVEAMKIPDAKPSSALIWSQNSWNEQSRSDCSIKAALVGGTGPWQGRRWRDCYVSQVESRTAFLMKIVTGEYDDWN